jgi:hypothetical protein
MGLNDDYNAYLASSNDTEPTSEQAEGDPEVPETALGALTEGLGVSVGPYLPQNSNTFDKEGLKDLMNTIKKEKMAPLALDAGSAPLSITDVKSNLIRYDQVIPAVASRRSRRIPKTGITQKWMNQFLPWVEQHWHERHYYPSTEDFMQKWGLDKKEVLTLNVHTPWLKCLDRRGVRRPDVLEDFLTSKQMAAIALITNVNDFRHQTVKLKSINVSAEEYDGWLQNTSFKNALSIRSENVFNNAGIDANLAIGKLVKNGDFRATKFYMEMTGKAQTPEQINIKQTIQILIEAVQKHADPATLQAIVAEVQQIRAIQGLD